MSSVPSAVAQNPAPNPVDQFGRLLQMKALLNQQSLFPGQQQQQQNQLQAEQQENQLRQQQLDDMNKIQKIAPNYVQKDDSGKVTGYDFDGLENGAIAAGVRPQSLAPLQTMRKNAADTLLAQSQANAKVLENVNTMNDQFRGHLEAVSNAAPEDRQAAYQAALDWSQQQTPKLDISHLPPANQLPTDDKTLRPMLTHFETSLAMGSQITKEAQEKAEAAKANAAAALDQIKIKIQQGAKPGDLDSLIDQTGADLGTRSLTKSQANFYLQRGDYDNATKVVNELASKVTATKQDIEKETNPAVIQAHAQAAVQVQQALQKLNPAAVATVPQHLVAPATAAYQKTGEEYATAVQSAQNLTDFINEAKSGNKSAVKIVPLQGALEITTAQGVHRINRTEVDQYGGAGDAYDKLAGKVGGVLTGKSIDDSVLNDMAAMQQKIAQNAAQLHANKVQTINQTYGSKFQPMQFQQTQPAASGVPAGATHTAKGSDGQKHYTNAQGQDLGVVPDGK